MMFNRMAITLMAALLLSAGFATAEAAEIDLSLNLTFNNTNDINSGGNWTVVGKADESGIAGIVLSLVDDSLNFDPLTGFLTPSGFEFEQSAVFGLRLEIVQGDDLSDSTLDVGVIGGTFPSSYVDVIGIVPILGNPDLGSFTGGVELATGTFDVGDIPQWFGPSDSSAGNVFNNASQAIMATVRTTVRATNIPEPTTLMLLACFVAPIGLRRRRQ